MKIETARFILSARRRSDLLHDGLPEIAFAGRSNVGKSSLLNLLLGRKSLARISSTPGRTRAVNYFLINSRFYFVDLPGYGYARVARKERRGWAKLVDDYLHQAIPRARVVQLVDAKVGATSLDVQAAEYFRDLGASATVVVTKIDRLPRGRRTARLMEIQGDLGLAGESKPVPFSARTGEG
ncbi:MAG: ribosome biogenesis GTP-binding protein YihA/YsxC, partial [Thermoanaerobaculia bacterium]